MDTPERERPTLEMYGAASLLDPLRLDEVFTMLPAINKAGDIATLANTLNDAVTRLAEVNLNKAGSMAALRDLDFLASSYLRHGRNPIEDIAGLEEAFIQLGDEVGTVPRGTVATYALANPADERGRSFTGDEDETLFIDAVRQTSLALECSLQGFICEDTKFALESFDSSLDTAIQSIVSVKRTLPAEYFTNEMRPYFDPLVVDGTPYLGAGGAQMQFVAFDYILWGADDTDTVYQKYYNESYIYLTPSQQSAIKQILARYNQNTILKHIAINGDKEAAVCASDALKKIKKFRYPHRKLAQENFKIRGEGQVGSGSYTPSILDVLLDKTEFAIEMAERIINQ